MGEAARRDLQAEVRSQQVSDLRQRHPHLRVQLDDQRDHAATELHASRAEGVGRLQLMAALHPTPTPQAVPDLDVEATHDRAHHGQVFLNTATPPGSLPPPRRSPGTSRKPVPRASHRLVPGVGDGLDGRTPRRTAFRDPDRDPAAGPWQTARPGGDPRADSRPTAASDAHSPAAAGRSSVPGACCRAHAASARPAAVRLRRPASQPEAPAPSDPRSSRQQLCHKSQNCTTVNILTAEAEPGNRRPSRLLLVTKPLSVTRCGSVLCYCARDSGIGFALPLRQTASCRWPGSSRRTHRDSSRTRAAS